MQYGREWVGTGGLVSLPPQMSTRPLTQGHRVADGIPDAASGTQCKLPSMSGAHYMYVLQVFTYF